MNIAWREVTWYSKLAAMAVFIALPFLGFWLGVRYEQAVGPRMLIVRSAADVPNSTTTDGSTGSAFTSSTIMDRPTAIIAEQSATIAAGREFTLQSVPNAVFAVRSLARLGGGRPVPICGPGTFVYLPNPNAPSGIGTCIPSERLAIGGAPAELVVVDLEVRNASNAYVNGRFLQLFYSPETGSDIESRVAVMLPALDAYGALPRSNRRTMVGFLVPRGQTQAQLVYGDYGKASGLGETPETLLGKSVNGFILNFMDRSLIDIPG